MSDNPPSGLAAVKATNIAVVAAKDLPDLLTKLNTVNPALYAQLTGTLATYAKSAAAPAVGLVVGEIVAKGVDALGVTWTADTTALVTNLILVVGAAGAAAINHWFSKRPANTAVATTETQPIAVANAPLPVSAIGDPK